MIMMNPITRIRSRRRQESSSPLFVDELHEQQKEIQRISISPGSLHSHTIIPPDEGKCCSIRTVQTATCQKKTNSGRSNCTNRQMRASCYANRNSENALQSANSSSTCIKRILPSARCRSATPDADSSGNPSSSASWTYTSTSVPSSVTSDLRVVDSAASFKSLIECPVSDSWHDSDRMNQCRVCPQAQTRRISDEVESWGADQINDNEWVLEPYFMSLSDDEMHASTNFSRKVRLSTNHRQQRFRTTCGNSPYALSHFDKVCVSENHADDLDGDTGTNSELSTDVLSSRLTGERHRYDDDSEVMMRRCQQRMDSSFDADDVLPSNEGLRWTPSERNTCTSVHRLYGNRFTLTNWKKRDDINPCNQYDGWDAGYDSTCHSYINADQNCCRTNAVKFCEKTNCVKASMRTGPIDKIEERAAKFQTLSRSELSNGTKTRSTKRDAFTESEESDRSSMDNHSAYLSDNEKWNEDSSMEEDSAGINENLANYKPRNRRVRSRVETEDDEGETEEAPCIYDDSDLRDTVADDTRKQESNEVLAACSTEWLSCAQIEGKCSNDSCTLSSYDADPGKRYPRTTRMKQDNSHENAPNLQTTNSDEVSKDSSATYTTSKYSATDEKLSGNEASYIETPTTTNYEAVPTLKINQLDEIGITVAANEITTLASTPDIPVGLLSKEITILEPKPDGILSEPPKESFERGTATSDFDDSKLKTILQSSEPSASDAYTTNIAQPTDLASSIHLQSTATSSAQNDYEMETSLVAPPSTAEGAISLYSQLQGYSSFSRHFVTAREDIMLLSRSLTVVSGNISPEDLELLVPSAATDTKDDAFDFGHESSVSIPGSLGEASEREPKEQQSALLAPPSPPKQQQLQRSSDQNASQNGPRAPSGEKLHLENAEVQARRVRTLPSLTGYHSDGFKTVTITPDSSQIPLTNYGTTSPVTPNQSWAVSINRNAQEDQASNQVITVRVSIDEALPVQQMQNPTDELESVALPAQEMNSEKRNSLTHLGAVSRTEPSPTSDENQRLFSERHSTAVALQQTRIPRLQTSDMNVIPRQVISSVKASPGSSQSPCTVINLQAPPTSRLLLQIQVLPQVTSNVANKPAAQTSDGGSSSQMSRIPVPITASGTDTGQTLLQLHPDPPKSSKDTEQDLPKGTIDSENVLKGSNLPTSINDDQEHDLLQKSSRAKLSYSTNYDNNRKKIVSESALETAKDSSEKDAENRSSAKMVRSAMGRLVESKPSESVVTSPKEKEDDDRFIGRSSLQMSKIPVSIRGRDQMVQTSPIHITTSATQTSSNLLQQPASLNATKDAKSNLLKPDSATSIKEDNEPKHPGFVKPFGDSKTYLQRSSLPSNTKMDRKDMQNLPQDVAYKLDARISNGSGSSQISKIPVPVTTTATQTSLSLLQLQPDLLKAVTDTKNDLQKPGSPKATEESTIDLQQTDSPKTTRDIQDSVQQPGSPDFVIDPKKDPEKPDSPKHTKDAQKDLHLPGADPKKILPQLSLLKTTKDVKNELKSKSSGTDRPYSTFHDSGGKKAISEITLKSAKTSPMNRAEDKISVKGAKSTLGLLLESGTAKSAALGKSKNLEKDQGKSIPSSRSTNLKKTLSGLSDKVDDKNKKPKSQHAKRQPRVPAKPIRRHLTRKSGVKAKLSDETKMNRKLREPAAKNPSLPEALKRSEAQVLHNPLALTGDEEVWDRLEDSSEEPIPQWEIVSSSDDGSLISILKTSRKSKKNPRKKPAHLTFGEEVEIMFIDDDEYMDVANEEDKDNGSEAEDEN